MKTIRTTTLLILSLAALVHLSSCSKLKEDLPVAMPAGIAAHPEGWTTKADSINFHGVAIKNNNYDMRSCRTCHGSTYTGGSTGVSCRTCHNQPAGPENCGTCHGGGTNGAAPAPDLDGNTLATFRGVGAHTLHLQGTGTTSSLSVACGECHSVPGDIYAAGHLDVSTPGRAEVILSSLIGRIGTGTPAYDSQTLKCNSTYCHGNWSLDSLSSPYKAIGYTSSKMTGANFGPVWNGGSTQGACGTCHGNPPTGHVASTLSTCGSCHWKVAQYDIVNNTGKIVDKVSHMNGRANIFGVERSF